MNGISKITVTDNVSLVSFEYLPADGKSVARLLSAVANGGVNVDMISQSAPCSHSVSLSFTIADDDLIKTLRICNELGASIGGAKPMVSSSNCKIQMYGAEMAETPGVAARAIEAIAGSGAELGLITTSEVDISCLVPAINIDEAVESVERTFSL